ncbi:MAG TPA: hypothetical protein VER08_10240 [Pyrinomonadaceae bacterium]|nr:hypothetical protein [Pyrinomonadaceae bacterium]
MASKKAQGAGGSTGRGLMGQDMVSKKAQSRAGAPAKRRGQQMGDARSAPDKTKSAQEETPALRGRRKEASEFFGDDSSQATGTRPETFRDNTPSVPAAIPTGKKIGESDGERDFKRRHKK